MPDRAASAALCIGAYTCAIAVGYGCAAVLAHTYADVSLLWVALAADVAATLAIFAFSMLADNSSVYDPYWMIGPALWLMWLKLAFGGAWHPRQTLAMSIVWFWFLRYSIQAPWPGWLHGLSHEDFRYEAERSRPVWGYWLFSLACFHLIPTVVVFFALAPASMTMLATEQPPLCALDAAGALVGVVAIVLTGVADDQLRKHRATAAPSEVCCTGLWAYSRHPNYFGETLFWVSLLPFGLAAYGGLSVALSSRPWLPMGAVVMVALIRLASVPMMDARSLARRPKYAAVMRDVSAFVPWPPQRGAVELK